MLKKSYNGLAKEWLYAESTVQLYLSVKFWL